MKGKVKNIIHFFEALVAVIYFGLPANRLKVIAVTGTDGKTTTATLIYHILKASAKKVALITTVAAYIGDKQIDTGFHVTTPNAWKLQQLIREIVKRGYNYLVLEATSHGIDQHRILGTNISIAVLTNITHEHLDYHKTYANYLRTKSKLFKNVQYAVLNKQDSSFNKVRKTLKKGTTLIAYDGENLPPTLIKAVNSRFSEGYNRQNADAAIKVAQILAVENKLIAQAIAGFPGVIGRMQSVKNNQGLHLFIDFAHTPNALKNVLTSLKFSYPQGKLIAVFGCAGERDRQKRPLMGEISAKLADISVFTAEDPRGENLDSILAEVVSGAHRTGAKKIKPADYPLKSRKTRHLYLTIPQRGEAIGYALQKLAKRGDTLVVCGKGHEKSMAYNGIEYPWSDYQAVTQALKGKVKKINFRKN